MTDLRRIEIIAIGDKLIFSVGAIVISKKGDVYHVFKFRNSDLHLSRHASGEMHWKSKKQKIDFKIRKSSSIADLKEIEILGTQSFGLDSLPELYNEYKLKKCNGIFAIDMREYRHGAFNMAIAILKKEGLPRLYAVFSDLKKRQIYLYADSEPLIAVIIGEVAR